MPNTRVILLAALAAILFLNYEAWMHDYPASTLAGTELSTVDGAATASRLGESVPQASLAAPGSAPPQSSAPPPPAALGAAAAPTSATITAAADAAVQTEPPVHVVTDIFNIAIDLKGGQVDRADLLQYPLHKDTPNIPVRLQSDAGDDALYLLQSGLLGGAGETAPTHLATWTSPEKSYVLAAGAQELRVPLSWSDGHGLNVIKTFTFTRGSYAIALRYDVRNDSDAPRSLAPYAQFLRRWIHASRSYFDVETYSFKGPAVFDGMKSRDLKVENETDSRFSEMVTDGWIASLQHHFVSAIVPEAGRPNKVQLQVQGPLYLLSATGPMTQVAAGARAEFDQKLFIGPKFLSHPAATE